MHMQRIFFTTKRELITNIQHDTRLETWFLLRYPAVSAATCQTYGLTATSS